MTNWYDDETFWETMGPFLFPQSRWAEAASDIDGVLELVKLPSGAAVLDMSCGPGRHSLELARRGFAVTAVDRTARYLAEARERAERDALNVEWAKADMRSFRRPEAFSAIINLYTSFAYFEDPDEDRSVVDNFYVCLKPGGRLVMDIMSKEILARIFRPRDWRELDDGSILLEDRKVGRDWGWIDVRWIALRGLDREEYRFGHRLYSATELVALLTDVGFDPVAAYGSLKGDPYDHESKRLVVLAHKPDTDDAKTS